MIFGKNIFLILILLLGIDQDANYWNSQAQATLNKMLRRRPNTNVAKNVIFFLGDGMGVSTVTAARIYRGQLNNQTGEEATLSFERFPDVGLVKVILILFTLSPLV